MRGFRKINNNNDILSDYLLDHPEAKWKDDFRNNVLQEDLDAIYNEIYTDQRGVCAYCEIILKWPTDDYTNDFRVEHFHPENCGDDNSHNYSLDWGNLFGCCHGGSQSTARSYVNSSFGKKHHSCDVPKGNKILDNIILNPLVDIPVDQTFFIFNEDGCMFVSEDCPDNMTGKAQSTIAELNLDCDRLRTLRSGVIDELREMILEEMINSEDENEDESILKKAVNKLREDLLTSVNKNEFYSTIDWYLAN